MIFESLILHILTAGLDHGGNSETVEPIIIGGRRPTSLALLPNRTSRGFGKVGLVGAISFGSETYLKLGFDGTHNTLDIYLRPSSSCRIERGGKLESTYRLTTGDVVYAPIQICKAIFSTTSIKAKRLLQADP